MLAHDLAGDGPELVLVHGITESRHSWDPLLATLTDRYRVLTVDLPGHGESGPADDYGPLALADAVHRTVAACGLGDPVVVGHSLGGVVASAYAAAHPTVGVVNVDQPLQLSAFQAALQQAAPLLRGSPAEFAAVIDVLFAAMDGPLPAGERDRIRIHGRADQAVVLAIWATVLEATPGELDATVDALAAQVRVPYLALHGLDPGPGYAEWLSARIPTATVEVWTEHGHYPHLVAPLRFASRLDTFVRSLTG
jgi:pimeloyl-ACP methyl ester carboxylesterase